MKYMKNEQKIERKLSPKAHLEFQYVDRRYYTRYNEPDIKYGEKINSIFNFTIPN